jgi:16S rRNA (adenine1518-N6/adenine1519-N6)-dimethyltransferase
VNEDILNFNLPEGFYKVIANLPYHIATPIITKFSRNLKQIDSITVMVQEEVARRMTANPKTEAFGSLSLYLKFYTEPSYAFHVSRNCFYPKPNVESAIVHFKPKEPVKVEDEEAFFALIRSVFQKRRKQLKSTIPKEVLEEAKVNPMSRPEELSLDEFLRLYNILLKR